MLRVWCKLLLLIVGLGVYGIQASAAEHHTHGWSEQKACAACVLHDTPSLRPTAVIELPLPPPAFPPLHAAAARDVDPPRALAPEDVSFATSPPRAPARVG